jgi:putative hemin transport protein
MITMKDQWKAFRRENPKVRIRDAARQLHTTEAEILAAFAGSSVMLLNKDFPGLLQSLPQLGYVMVLTRNESCVHERKGVFEHVDVKGGHVGLVLGKDIDLRVFFKSWAFAFAQFADEEAGFKDSIQVFDHQGTAIIKIYLQDSSDRAAFGRIVRDFSAPVQDHVLHILPAPAPPTYHDDTVNVDAFRQDWTALKDTHEFSGMLMKHRISRLHALHIAGDEFARKVSNDAATEMLNAASGGDWEIMVFVGNHGNIQIHTGPVKKIMPIPGWINVMDPAFNLHLRLTDIHESWIVYKPTDDGPVHSLEVYDAKGDMIVQFFGKRKPGVPENAVWQEWIRQLADMSAVSDGE